MSVPNDPSSIEDNAAPEVDASAPAPTPSPAAPQVASATSEASPPTIGNDRNIVLPKDAFNARLKAATEKGRKAAMADLDAKVRAGGFSSLEEMVQFVAQAKSAASAPKTAQPETTGQAGKGADKRTAKEIERARLAQEQERSARVRAEKRAKQLEADYNAFQAEAAIREMALAQGIKDREHLDYVVARLTRKCEGKTEAELKAFDENKFFEELREKQPYLFGETVRPVTTGTGGKEPPAPTPGTVHRSSATNGQTDVKKMSKQEFDAHLQKMGLRPTSHIV